MPVGELRRAVGVCGRCWSALITVPLAGNCTDARDFIVTVAAYGLASWLVVERFEGLAWSRPQGDARPGEANVSRGGEAGGTGATQCGSAMRLPA